MGFGHNPLILDHIEMFINVYQGFQGEEWGLMNDDVVVMADSSS